VLLLTIVRRLRVGQTNLCSPPPICCSSCRSSTVLSNPSARSVIIRHRTPRKRYSLGFDSCSSYPSSGVPGCTTSRRSPVRTILGVILDNVHHPRRFCDPRRSPASLKVNANGATQFPDLIEGLLVNAASGVKITCRPVEFNVVIPPSGQGCLDYLNAFTTSSSGYAQVLANGDCGYCAVRSSCPRVVGSWADTPLHAQQYATGDQFLAALGMSFSHRWRNVGFMCAYIVFNTAAVFFLTYLVGPSFLSCLLQVAANSNASPVLDRRLGIRLSPSQEEGEGGGGGDGGRLNGIDSGELLEGLARSHVRSCSDLYTLFGHTPHSLLGFTLYLIRPTCNTD
jgi:hypothetical protein